MNAIRPLREAKRDVFVQITTLLADADILGQPLTAKRGADILLYGRTVMNVLGQLSLRTWAHPPHNALLCSQGSGPNRGVYHVKAPDSPSIDMLVDQVRSTWMPLLLSYSGNWNNALDHTLTHPQD